VATVADGYAGNPLRDIGREFGDLTKRRQMPKLASFAGKMVLRAGKLIKVQSASRRGVVYTVIATESEVRMSADGFLRRAIEVVETPKEYRRKLKADPLDLAYDIAAETELPAVDRVLRLRRLKKDHGPEVAKAVEWYVRLIQTGQPIRRWKPEAEEE